MDSSILKEAISLSNAGQHRNAEILFRRYLMAHSEDPSSHYNLAVCLQHLGDLPSAIIHLRKAVNLDSRYGLAHRVLGELVHRVGDSEAAIEWLQKAIALYPADVHAFNALGVVLNDLRRHEEASIYLLQATRVDPESADAHNNLGIAQTALGQFDLAKASLHRALSIRPHFAAAHTNLGSAHKALGETAEAIAQYDLSLLLEPDSVTTRWNRALALLQKGDFEKGWSEYEWRWQRHGAVRRRTSPPPWKGEVLAGKRLLLYAEQGLGDTLQFIRFAPELRKLGAHVIFACPSPLFDLIKDCDGLCDEVIGEDQSIEATYACPLLSLPLFLKATPTSISRLKPYLQVSKGCAAKWGERLAALRNGKGNDLKVGIVWQGNPHHPWDRFRSIPLRLLGRLAQAKDVSLISLQIGPGMEQTEEIKHENIDLKTLWDATSEPSMADLAAIMTHMDLVVSVDTAPAHLAGGLGIPVWIVLASLCDWRWMQDCTSTPWYPTVRLVRQKELFEWEALISSMYQDLEKVAGKWK